MPRIDLHVHSAASFDCRVPPAAVARRCRALGLDPVVLTDHASTAGALELREAGVPVIVGEEVMTSDGELIGLFLERPLEEGLSPAETAREIHRQGGLVYLEHPYDEFRRHLSEEAIESIAEAIDIVEVWNGRSTDAANLKAAELQQTLGAAAGAGSDAHHLDEVGRGYVELEPFDGAAEFLAALRRGRVVVRPNRLLMRARRLLGPRRR